MARYHITITDNKEGKTIHDRETDIIIGVFGCENDAGEMTGIIKTAQWDAPGKRIVHAMIALDELRDENNKDHPLEALLVKLYKNAAEDDEKEGDDEWLNTPERPPDSPAGELPLRRYWALRSWFSNCVTLSRGRGIGSLPRFGFPPRLVALCLSLRFSSLQSGYGTKCERT